MSSRPTRASGKRKAEEPAKAPAAAEKTAQKKGGKKKKLEEPEEPEACHDIFMKEIAKREKQLKKHCIIIEMVDTDEDETTLEQLRALKRVFVPERVQENFIEVWSELDEVGQDESGDEGEEGDDADATMKAFMMMFMGKCLTTKHAAEMQTILEAQLDFIDQDIKSQSWQDAFCRWVATVVAAKREPHWWEDTDMPDDALDIYERLRGYWLELKDKSDEELRGLVCEIPGLTVKDELAQYLQGLADEMKQLDYKVTDLVNQPKPNKQKKAPAAKPRKEGKTRASQKPEDKGVADGQEEQKDQQQAAKKPVSKKKGKKLAVDEQRPEEKQQQQPDELKRGGKSAAEDWAAGQQGQEQQEGKQRGSKKRGVKAVADVQQQAEEQQQQDIKAKSSKQAKKGKSAPAAEVPAAVAADGVSVAKKQKFDKKELKEKTTVGKGGKAKVKQ